MKIYPQDKTKNFPRGVDRLLLNSGMEALLPSLRLRPEPFISLFSTLLASKGSPACTVPLHVIKTLDYHKEAYT